MNHYAYARKQGLSKEDAEDYSQWIELRKLEDKSTNCPNHRVIDFLRLTYKDYRNQCLLTRSGIPVDELPSQKEQSMLHFFELIQCLNERDQIIVVCKMVRGMTLEDIGGAFNLSLSRISQLYKMALLTIKNTQPPDSYTESHRA